MPRKFRLSVHRKNEERRAAPQSLTVTLPITTPGLCYSVLQRSLRRLLVLPEGWIEVAGAQIVYSCIEQRKDGNAKLTCSLAVHQADFRWHVEVDGRHLSCTSFPSTLPATISSVQDAQQIVDFINTSTICCGNDDDKFIPLVKEKETFMDVSGTKLVARFNAMYATIRHEECEIFVQSQSTDSTNKKQCSTCKKYRQVLNRLLFRLKNETHQDTDRTNPTSHTNYRFLNSPEKADRLHRLHQQVRLDHQRIARLKESLDQIAEGRSVPVGDALHEELKQIMQDNTITINQSYPPNSFARIFWESQQQAARMKSSRSMRWDPLMIRWCLYLRHLSSSAYETIRETGVIRLPCQRTLQDYTYYTKAAVGFSADVDRQVMEEARIMTCPEREKYVIIIMDEMHLREGLVMDKHTGEVIGFTDLGDINSHLLKFEQTFMDKKEDLMLPHANSMLVILVRGLFSQLKFPYAQFPCTELSGDQMYDPFWEAVGRLELCGFKVLALTCDGLAANRRLFKLHNPKSSSLVYKVSNSYATDGRSLYFFVDPPHLIKTVRNGWANSKRHLLCNGKEILWSHLTDLYYKNRSSSIPGLALVPKLKYEHISLSSFSKMRVDLAAQVLSSTVAHALELTGGKEVEETVKFVSHFDKFFDSLNVSSLSVGKLSRNPFKSPYRSAKDFRLKWLEDDFLSYLHNWENSVRKHKDLAKAEQHMMLLSAETRLGLEITVHSFVELVKYVFTIPGVSAFLSNRICQDPIENFFGQQRQRGRACDNPNAKEFIKATQALRVINGTCRTIRGNCRGAQLASSSQKRILLDSETNTPLPKRRYKHK